MNQERTKIIACKTVIEEMRPLLPAGMETFTLESGLHLRPERLRVAIQEIVDDITDRSDTIILGYGLCSMGVVGLKAAHSTLIVPRLDDCIAIFLGSRGAYRRELNQEPGTYFLSRGWIEAEITLLDDLKKMEERYGRERALMLIKRMLQNYKRLAYIDTGGGDQEPYRRFSRRTARELDLDYQEIKGTPNMLQKICRGPWDHDFMVVPPGRAIRFEDFELIPAKEGKQAGR